MNLKQYFLTKNECYKRNAFMEVLGLMLHSTGANNPNLKRYIPNFDGTIGDNRNGNHWDQYRPDGRQVCVHGFIGKLADGSIATVQTLPWNMKGWHAGKSAGNNSYIGVEICEDGLNDSDYFNKVYNEAVELFAYLCEEFHLNPLTDILCHSEGWKKGIASNHGDVMHWFPKHGKSMDTFRNDVKNKLNGTSQKTNEPITSGAACNYLVKIITDELNVRKGYSTDYPVETTIKKDEVYTIVEEKTNASGNLWGKLKSGAGWISLNNKYVTRNISTPKPTVTYYKACNSKYTSLVDALKSIGVDSSKGNRKKIAQKNGIANYTGTSSQNNALLLKLKKGTLKKA